MSAPTEYRSAIFTTTPEQAETARRVTEEVQAQHFSGRGTYFHSLLSVSLLSFFLSGFRFLALSIRLHIYAPRPQVGACAAYRVCWEDNEPPCMHASSCFFAAFIFPCLAFLILHLLVYTSACHSPSSHPVLSPGLCQVPPPRRLHSYISLISFHPPPPSSGIDNTWAIGSSNIINKMDG